MGIAEQQIVKATETWWKKLHQWEFMSIKSFPWFFNRNINGLVIWHLSEGKQTVILNKVIFNRKTSMGKV